MGEYSQNLRRASWRRETALCIISPNSVELGRITHASVLAFAPCIFNGADQIQAQGAASYPGKHGGKAADLAPLLYQSGAGQKRLFRGDPDVLSSDPVQRGAAPAVRGLSPPAEGGGEP